MGGLPGKREETQVVKLTLLIARMGGKERREGGRIAVLVSSVCWW
jgi:hypothetical protein